jgi:hypothetical protein
MTAHLSEFRLAWSPTETSFSVVTELDFIRCDLVLTVLFQGFIIAKQNQMLNEEVHDLCSRRTIFGLLYEEGRDGRVM